jgi:hypothetical protein
MALAQGQAGQADWKQGDKVVHKGRPEWGVGEVTAVASETHEGQACQRVSVRFARAGLKTLSTAFATLGPADERPGLPPQGGWLPPASDETDQEVMIRLPEPATDPFLPATTRLRNSLDLFRFTGTGASLIDWAVIQSGLDDPLSRFNRHQLEQFFERFRTNLDGHVRKLAGDLKRADPAALAAAVANAPVAAQRSLRGFDARR